jgi:hypothetical protein
MGYRDDGQVTSSDTLIDNRSDTQTRAAITPRSAARKSALMTTSPGWCGDGCGSMTSPANQSISPLTGKVQGTL